MAKAKNNRTLFITDEDIEIFSKKLIKVEKEVNEDDIEDYVVRWVR